MWYDGDITGGNHFWLIDSTNEHYTIKTYLRATPSGSQEFTTEKECIDYLKDRIIQRLKHEGYRSRKDNIVTKSYKQVWP